MFPQRFQNYSENRLGNSSLRIKQAGCTTCAVYTLNRMWGGVETPLINNRQLQYDAGGSLFWNSINNLSKTRFLARYRTFQRTKIRNDVLTSKGVLIEISAPGVPGGRHWLTVLRLGWGAYVCFDPWLNTTVFISVNRVVGSAHFSRK